jgi:two-component system, NtrC family, nitrogen regulation sensor histidine kinase NtrY
MVYRHFRIQVSGRVLALSATLGLFCYLLLHPAYRATTLVAGLAAAAQVWALIHYVERTNRELSRFFLAVKHADFSQSFGIGSLGASFAGLKRAFDEVLEAFRQARAEKEEHSRYLQTVVQHVGVGLVAMRADGQVELVNTAARRLLRLNHLKDLRQLEKQYPGLAQALRQLRPQRQTLVRIEDDGEVRHLALHAAVFRLRDQEYTLVSLQNIQSELEDKEMEAWQQLIRVLTHEIMNSITPIASLAGTANGMLTAAAPPDRAALADVRQAVQAIQRRSESLLRFVDAYRQLTRMPPPQFQLLSVDELFQRTARLLRPQLEEKRIALRLEIDPPSLELTADPGQVEQVLINLIHNAMQALEGREGARILLRAGMDDRGRPRVEVADNGPGIVAEALEKIFLPFFTTRPEGSGIGLSLCRQIMRLHRGAIGVRSRPGVETVFTLRF